MAHTDGSCLVLVSMDQVHFLILQVLRVLNKQKSHPINHWCASNLFLNLIDYTRGQVNKSQTAFTGPRLIENHVTVVEILGEEERDERVNQFDYQK